MVLDDLNDASWETAAATIELHDYHSRLSPPKSDARLYYRVLFCLELFLSLGYYLIHFSLALENTRKMPIPILAEVGNKGVHAIPFLVPALKLLPWLVSLYLAKWYFGGASNVSERLMKSKVVMITV